MKKYLTPNPVTITIITVVVGVMAYYNGFFLLDKLEQKTIDWRFHLRGEADTGPNVVLAVVDEKSLAQEGAWVWPRSKLADLVTRLSDGGARVIAMDIAFLEPDNKVVLETIDEIAGQARSYAIDHPQFDGYLETLKSRTDNDQLLATAIRNSKARVVLGYFFHLNPEEAAHMNRDEMPVHRENILDSRYTAIRSPADEPDMADRVQFPEAVAPQSNIKVISDAADYAGTFSQEPDDDGVIRRLPAIFKFEDSQYAPLSIMAVSAFLDAPIIVGLDYDTVVNYQIGELFVPTDEVGRIMINYRGGEKTFPHISVTDILHDNVPEGTFRDKIVLVGATAHGIYDTQVTPFEEIYPGPEIHANVIDSILAEDFLQQPDAAKVLDYLAIILGVVLLGIILSRTGPVVGGLSAAGFFFGYTWLCHYMFSQQGWILNVLYPLTAILLIYLGITAYEYFTESKEKRFVRSTFTKYLAPAVVKQLMDSPEKVALGGAEREITAFFSDIQGFTSISEKLTATELVELLNVFLTEMADIILEYGGTVDKFEGDAIIAMFGAPIDMANHAEVAAKASIDMQKRLVALREVWKAEGKPELRMRIGLESGPAVVGNMGSLSRMDYTMMGNTVNTASRLEGVNKQYGMYSMIGETTYEAAGDSVACREIDLVNVVGKEEPVKVYQLLGYPGDVDDRLRETVDHYHEGLHAYRDRDWDRAIGAFNAALAVSSDDGPSKTMLTRCDEFKLDPPDADWDGTYTMKTK